MRLSTFLTAATLAFTSVSALAQTAPPPFDRRVATFPLSDLMGLDEAGLREKLGVTPAEHAYLSAVENRDGVETRILHKKDFIFPGDTCGEGAEIHLVLQEDKLTYTPLFEFTDGKLTGVRYYTGAAPRADVALTRSCVQIATLSAASEATYMVLLSPFAAVGAAMMIPDLVPLAQAKSALADLRLGAQPPGGMAAYIKRPPPQVRVGRPVDGRQVLTVEFVKAAKLRPAALVRVTAFEGRVVRIERDKEARFVCALMPNGAMKCDMPTVRKTYYYPPT